MTFAGGLFGRKLTDNPSVPVLIPSIDFVASFLPLHAEIAASNKIISAKTCIFFIFVFSYLAFCI